MYLTDDERNALLRVGGTADRRGYFDKNKVFTEHNVLTLRSLQDKGLISREHEQYFLTPAGREVLQQIQQAEKCKSDRAEEIRREKQHKWVREIVLLLLGALITVIVTLITK